MDPSPFWVLMALCWFVNEKKATGTTGACWPSIKKIAAKAHVSELTARKSIKVLMEKKFITAHQPPGKVRVFYVDFSRIKELAGGKDLEGVKDVSGVKDLEGGPLKMLKGRGERSLPPPLKDLEAEQGNNKEQNKEENRESSMRTSGTSSAIAAVASAQAQTPYPEDFDQSLFDEAQREAQLAGEKTTDEPPMKEEKPKRKRSSNVQKPESVSEQVWNDFTALRTKRRAPITETALKGIQREAEKAGITLEEALSTCCERGWQGFMAKWYRREKLEQKNASKAEYQLPSNDDWDNFDTAHYA
nr:MAG TPA_asm: helix-turn-helix domain protein [Caudoviricetes sp.]